ncbi:coiled-coil alpha-helical rod protein 1 [Aplysia californica]|uniref:Coiled-coil alpha-helical rod protein 1 n=1 Tax=Aplysia californica TaxID=6500 RepID=A0ABM0K1T2_APLCA|nr:coiled-coil alpha-helical rod protein 1 [Aplysia californica]
MAANLNKPADFALKREKEKEKILPFLIPPSEFEKPVIASRSELDKAKKEIQELREQNDQLKVQYGLVHQQAAATSFASSHNEYADELIKRQAGEIADLRRELSRCREIYEQEAAEWDRKFAAVEAEHLDEVKRREKENRLREDEFEQRITRVSAELQRTMETAEEEELALKERLESTRSVLGSRVKELEEELDGLKRDSHSSIRKLEADIRNKERSVEDQEHQIAKLKTYIGEVEQSHRPVQVWRAEKETVDNKLRMAEAENQKFQSELELMGVRFKALENILSVQETELSKAKSKHSGKDKQYEEVLTGWRRKVYSLLVQQKSSDIVSRNDVNNLKQRIKDLEDQLMSSEAKSDMLQHSLKDKSAQLQIELNNKQRIQDDLSQVQQVAECLDDQSKESSQHLSQFLQFVNRYDKKSAEIMKTLEEKCSSLKAFGQRVSFAASRMEYLKAQFIRKAAFTNTSGTQNDSKKSLSVSRADEDMSRDSEDHLYQELERVMRERDSLATQVKEDTSKWSQRLTQTQTQYRSEVSTLKRTVEELEYDIQQKSKTCSQLTDELETIRESMREKDDTIAQLQAELERHAKGIETVLTDQHLRDEAEYSNRLAEVEKRLNESKREHAKAVVSLRQLERNHAREQQRSQELLRTTEEHLGRQIQQLHTQLVSVEKERNVVMATLRQEGLISKLKTDRGEPARLTLEEVDTALRGIVEGTTPTGEVHFDFLHKDQNEEDNEADESRETLTKDSGQMEEEDLMPSQQSHEPVERVLEDLKSLTAAIFDDDEEEEEGRKEHAYKGHGSQKQQLVKDGSQEDDEDLSENK